MILTGKEQEKVAKNIGLIHRVIQDKLQPPYQVGMYSYEDLFQIGSIGLCKAAATDKGGTFSTYAYRLICMRSVMPWFMLPEDRRRRFSPM